jgi:DNA-binding transcriptional LysR family regulator
MEFWQLRTFCMVAKTLHFTRASEELNLSQPAVSHQIKLLETEIGEPLFLREKDGILLTKAGQTMYEHANKILDIADELRLEITEKDDSLSGKIILGYASRGLGNPFSLYYDDFKKHYRDIDIIFQSEHKLEDIVEKVKNGKVDLGLVSHNLDLEGLEVFPYAHYELFLVVGKDHPLAVKKEVTPADLKNEEWVLFDETNRLRKTSLDFMEQAGIKIKNMLESNDGAFIRSMVVFGKKISLLPEWGVFEEIKDGKIIPLRIKNEKCVVQIYFIWKAARRTKILSAVLTYLLNKKLEGLELTKSTDETKI